MTLYVQYSTDVIIIILEPIQGLVLLNNKLKLKPYCEVYIYMHDHELMDTCTYNNIYVRIVMDTYTVMLIIVVPLV